ncbi:hypothetical protein PQX77_002521 [Marasmius sp. AFHP31]|nr:hypothetical protein PQX77_002521 [Marasmius sp. AFHP31]
MHDTSTPVTPSRRVRPPFSNLSPIKSADNSFAPTPFYRFKNARISAENQPVSPSKSFFDREPSILSNLSRSLDASTPFTFDSHLPDHTPETSPVPPPIMFENLGYRHQKTPQTTSHPSLKRKALETLSDGRPAKISTPIRTTPVYAEPPPSQTDFMLPSVATGSSVPMSESAALGFSPALTDQVPATFNVTDIEHMSVEERLHHTMSFARRMGFPLQELIYELFRTPTDSEKEAWQDKDHIYFRSRAATVSKWLRGETNRTPAQTLKQWVQHPYGRRHKDSPDMFSLNTPYEEINSIRPALTSFGAQVVQRELVSQARKAVKPSSGLHVHIPTKKNPVKQGVSNLDWRHFGVNLHQTVARIHRLTQGLLWDLLAAVATPDRQKNRKEKRKYRPVEKVVSTAISKLAFSRSPHARLGPMMEGLFNFASLTPFNKFRYDSHTGTSTAHSTVIRSLDGLSERLAMALIDLCRDPGRWFWLIPDNVQNFIRRRSQWAGHVNFMNLGMACTAWARSITSAPDPAVFDYEDKQKRRESCQRNKLTTSEFVRLADPDHERHVFAFQWIWVLGHHAYEHLGALKTRASERFRTTGLKQKVPDEAVDCFPLPTNSGTETQLPDFLGSVLDFLESCGQTGERHHKRMLPIGGDGLTFELLHKLMQQRQFHTTPFHSLRVLNPTLQWWHLFWTNDNRIIDRHIGNPAVPDASSFGYSLAAINQTLSKEQGKYSYNKSSELLYLVLDARMLDCWRLLLSRVARSRNVSLTGDENAVDIVEALHRASKLPTVDEFEAYGYELHGLYTTETAIHRTAIGRERKNAFRAPTSPPPTPATAQARTDHQLLAALDALFDTPSHTEQLPHQGDAVLASAKDFMREAMRSRECVWAVAEGDVGRVWEQILNLFFCFTSSSHKKYAQYLLEVIIDLQYESSPELRQALLSTAVATLSGLPGTHRCCDLLQEFFQRILEEIVQHKGAGFGEHFIRHVIARNLANFQHLKDDFLEGVGLEKRRPATFQAPVRGRAENTAGTLSTVQHT